MDIDYDLLQSWLKEPAPGEEASAPEHDEAHGTLRAVAARLRGPFHAALVDWYDGSRERSALAAMDRIFAELESASGREQAKQLWWVAGGVIEALLHGGLQADDALKLLFGRLDRYLRAAAATGDGAAPPQELLNELLGHLAQAGDGGERVAAIRRTFALGELPVRRAPEEGGALPGRHAAKLLHTVAAAIKEDLDGVKGALDRLARDGSTAELTPHLVTLARLGDTLAMLGMEVPRRAVEAQIGILYDIREGRLAPREGELVEMAGALLFIETALDGLINSCADLEEWGERVLTDLSRIRDGGVAQAESGHEALSALEYRRVIDAVLHEARIELSRIIDALRHHAADPREPGHLEEVPELLEGLQGALAMLQRPKAVGLLGIVQRRLTRDAASADAAPLMAVLEEFDRYLATAEEERSDGDHRLDRALELAARLDEVPSADPADTLPNAAAL